MNKQKRPGVASLLSLILPGAGLAYLGKQGWGFLNLCIVVAVVVVASTVLSDDAFDKCIGVVAAVCSAGSAVVAHVVTKAVNRQAASVDGERIGPDNPIDPACDD